MSEQPVVDTAMATEQAKQLVKSRAISVNKAENKNSGFKSSGTLDGKVKDPKKGTVPTFQLFQRSMLMTTAGIIQMSPEEISVQELCIFQ